MLMAIQVDTTISHKTDDIMLDGIKTEVPGPKVSCFYSLKNGISDLIVLGNFSRLGLGNYLRVAHG